MKQSQISELEAAIFLCGSLVCGWSFRGFTLLVLFLLMLIEAHVEHDIETLRVKCGAGSSHPWADDEGGDA